MWVFVSGGSKATRQATVIFLFTILSSVSSLEIESRCESNHTRSIEIFRSSQNILGRYNIQICTLLTNISALIISWRYYSEEDSDSCNADLTTSGALHAVAESKVNGSCSNDTSVICYMVKPFDFITNGCYQIQVDYEENKKKKLLSLDYNYISNNVTNQSFGVNDVSVIYGENDTNILVWTSIIPIDNFDVELYNHTESIKTKINVTCRRFENVYKVECVAPRASGNYEVVFIHDQPWTKGVRFDIKCRSYRYFNNSRSSTNSHTVKQIETPWIYIIIVVLIATVTPAVYFIRCIIRRNKSKPENFPEGTTRLVDNKKSKCSILLVYASEDLPEGQALVKLFTDNGAKVFDIQSPITLARAGPAPSEWVASMIDKENIKVVMLQTRRTTEASSIIRTNNLRTSADTMVAYCWRRLTDTPEHPTPYNKFFVAKFPGSIESPHHKNVVPFTRFIITQSAANLLYYTGVIPDVGSARGIEEFNDTVRGWAFVDDRFDKVDIY